MHTYVMVLRPLEIYIDSYSAGIDFRCQNVTSTDVRFCLKTFHKHAHSLIILSCKGKGQYLLTLQVRGSNEENISCINDEDNINMISR